MLQLGLITHDWAEVLSGLKPNAEYVFKNSYIIKADIEKSGTSHDHRLANMLDAIIRLAIQCSTLIIISVVVLIALGLRNATRSLIDAAPDITNSQVVINTEAPGYTPLEVEQRVSYPIETAMAGLPNLNHTRSLSRYGLSQITVIFNDDTDIYYCPTIS